MSRGGKGQLIGSEGSLRDAGERPVSSLFDPEVRRELDPAKVKSHKSLAQLVSRLLEQPEVEAELAALDDQREGGAPTSVYRLFDGDGQLLYVGVTRQGYHRLHQHSRDKPWWPEVATASFEHLPDRLTALRVESKAIRDEGPKHNMVGGARFPEADVSPRVESGYRVVKGINVAEARRGAFIYPEEAWDGLEHQAQRYFGLSAEGLIRQWEAGQVTRDDARLVYVLGMMALVNVPLEDFGP